MSGDATVEVCDNCGSPLDLDFDGNCRWCHAHVQIGPLGRQRASLGPDSGLVPDGVDDCSSSAHLWHKGLKKAGDGPDEFRELRYKVIRHSPSPVYISYPRGQR